VVQVGKSGESGIVEFSDVIVSSMGAQAGAILIEWNLASSTSTPSGLWDVHTRVGGFAGSQLQLANCPTTPTSSTINTNCIAAFMSMHITKSASGLYMENNWLWVADHDVEDPGLTQITIYAGRGLLIESTAGGIWLVGTAVEHHQLYQYQLSSTKNIFLGQIQTETAYYQPNPDATVPFSALTAYNDPVIPTGGSGWGLRLVSSSNILIYGAGLYSFFSNYNVHCSDQGNGETCQSRIFSVESSSGTVYNLNTVGTTNMITKDGVDIASYSDNLGGFIDTIALFRF
jgi:glucan 1,3-beta-glucosidase